MTRFERGQQHIMKAERLLSWAHAWLDELRDHGRHARVEEAERAMFATLSAITSSHDALASAANLLGRRDWCEQLHHAQSHDPLLRYLWLARHLEMNEKLMRWRPERANTGTEVVDAHKLRHITSLFFSPLSPQGPSQRLQMYAHGVSTNDALAKKLGSDALPDANRLSAAGLERVYGLDALALQDFEVEWGGRTERVVVPAAHLGMAGDYRAADKTLEAGIVFYRARSDALTASVGAR
jgi:hypothetical protein